MKSGPQQVAKRIRDELAEEKVVLAHVERDWLRFVETGDDAYLKATAYDLHGFYGGLERIFEAVATTIDGSGPGGESWHRDLLQQMGREMVPERIKALVEKLPRLSDEVNTSLQDFAQFLDRVSDQSQ